MQRAATLGTCLAKVDVYSWALICWFILTRSWPYKHATYEQFSTAVFENGERPAIDSGMHALRVIAALVIVMYSICSSQHINTF
eukprot:11905-Heterococcus_DN1.PRE.2